MELLDSIDIDYAKQVIALHQTQKLIENLSYSTRIHGSLLLDSIDRCVETIAVYDKLISCNSSVRPVEISMNQYIKLIRRTTAHVYCFSLSLNVLRIIGGYSALAYSGNM